MRYFFGSGSVSGTLFAAFVLVAMSSFGVFAQSGNASQKGLEHGQGAINRLGARLPAVAQRYGKSAEQLRRQFLEDPTLYVDQTDSLLFVDDATEQAQSVTSDTPVVSAAPYDYSKTFQLHSRPGSPHVIYLDFDGYVTSGTAWNANYTGGQPINSAPFSLDSDPTTFNTQEMDAIQYIWQRVAEDYAPFDVDVTTQDPGDAAIYRSDSSDNYYGARAVISPTNFTGSAIGGIAYVGVYNYSGTYYKPAFIMTSGLGNDEKNIAEATSHEVGHNLGLSHDGVKNADGSTTGYYSGAGNWAPIMGVGYYREVTQWSKGEYPGANNTEDDLAVMQTYGAALIPDDHGNTISTATALSGTNISATGVITTRTDVDVFKFSTGSGNVSININPAPRGANLDILAKILDSQGNVVASADPAGLPSSLSVYLSAGVYYLSIDGVGAGDLTTGYSDYASLGQYSISGTLVSSNVQPPVADVAANPTSGTAPLTVAFSSVNSYDPDGSIASYSWNFGDGTNSTSANPSHVYNTAGTFTAALTVTDNSGLTGSSSVVITTSAAPANQAPVAVAGANVTSGVAPLAVNFSSQGSYDPDGTIASYSWNFGDGTGSTAASPSHTYSTVGNFTATLTVTDNSGATNSKSVAITVQSAPSVSIYVNSISVTTVTSGSKSYGQAVITVVDSNGQLRPNVTVTGKWSGLATDSDTGVTNANGQVTFTSNSVPSRKSGTFTISVTGLSASGYTYDPTRNVKSSASVTK